jgi:hypothetical protein
MHVLHRPYLPRAIAVTAIAAMLAIILTLVIAGGLSDIASPPAPATASGTAGDLHASVARPALGTGAFRSPFSPLLSAPVTAPWAQNSR